MSWHRNTERVLAAGREAGLAMEVLRYPEGTRTAQDAATAIGCEVGAIVKSLVLSSASGPLVVLTSGANQVDMGRVAQALGVTGVGRADADAARAATGYPIGGTPPLGHVTQVPVLFDADLLKYETVWAAAGTPDTVFAAAPADLASAAGATIQDVRAG